MVVGMGEILVRVDRTGGWGLGMLNVDNFEGVY